jgi:hypothetical protein
VRPSGWLELAVGAFLLALAVAVAADSRAPWWVMALAVVALTAWGVARH